MRSCLRPARGGILHHADSLGEAHEPCALEAVEHRIEQRRQDLARPIRAIVEHQETVTVLHAGIAGHHRRLHELVVEFRRISPFDGLGRRGCGFTLGIDDRVIGKRHAVPALVPVHRIEASGHRREADRQPRAQAALDVRDAFERAARRHVAAVEEGVDGDRHAGTGDQVGQRHEMILVGMHAAGRGETHQVAGAAVLLEGGEHVGQQRIARQRPVFDRRVDARQLGHRDPAGAEIHVAHFRIAHLPLGQADETLGGVDQSLGAGRDEAIEVGGTGIEDGVVPRVGPEAPAVENAQDGRARMCSRHQEALPACGRRYSTALNLLGQLRSRGSVLGFWSGISIAQNTNSPRDSPSTVTSYV